MKLLRISFKYLKKYPFFAGCAFISIILASFFEGISFGMLIPLIQGMVNETTAYPKIASILGRLGYFFALQTQAQIISSIFILLFLVILLKNIFVYFSSILIARLRFGIIEGLKVDLMDNLIEYDMEYFDRIKKGYLVSNINDETTRMGDFIAAVLNLIALSARVVAYIALLFFISWTVSICVLVLIAIVLTPLELIMKRIKKLGAQVSTALVDYNYKLVEILSGIRLIKGYGTEELEKNSFRAATRRTHNLQYDINRYISLLIPLSEVLVFGLIVFCFLVTINIIKINIVKIFPLVATYLVVLTRMLTQLNALNNRRSEAVSRLAAFSSYEELYNQRAKQTIRSGSRVIDRFCDSIKFKNISFSYLNGRQILNNINIEIPRGRMTAIVGASGVGKTTLVNLVARFYDVSTNEILVDGINLKDLTVKEWRKKIGFVSQDIFIFNTSVKDNIVYGYSGVSEEEIIEASKAAGAYDFIMKLPDKYNTILGERGIKISGGEKQRLSIARAIIRSPEILILDEATSSVDTETERLIAQAIDKLTKDRTVIAIAHRLSTILHADNIIVLHEGRVVEQGKHSDLIRKNGLYKRFYDMQFIT